LTGLPFAQALQQLVFTPLGIEAYLGDEPERTPATLADVRGRYAGSPIEPFNSRFWRSLALPWAGLVTNLDGMWKLIRAWEGYPHGFLRDATRRDAVANQVGDLSGGQVRPLWWSWCPWGLGPELHGTKTPHWVPPTADADSFGHAGASGCLVWSDPAKRVTWALLGTRTADNGWLIRYGSQISAALLAATDEQE
jgi:CubicO group peptidase (beta-lactamase class C family)